MARKTIKRCEEEIERLNNILDSSRSANRVEIDARCKAQGELRSANNRVRELDSQAFQWAEQMKSVSKNSKVLLASIDLIKNIIKGEADPNSKVQVLNDLLKEIPQRVEF